MSENRASPNEQATQTPQARRGGGAASVVALGIILSRLMGIVRTWALARYLGLSMPAGAFAAALRIPNFLQNLFGEGVLSASFIPVYAKLVGQGKKEEADRLAWEIFALLSVLVTALVALGEATAPQIVNVIARFPDPEARLLTVRLVRILFPGVGILVLSAWCLGILNSHYRFFLAYAAPVAWNFSIIATLLLLGPRSGGKLSSLAEYVSYAAVAGSFLQLAVQLPTVLRLVGRFRPSLAVADESVRQVIQGFGPIVVGRGVVQISAYLDTIFASGISARANSALTYAQTIYLLPISVFGMAISVAELPQMSQLAGTTDEIAIALRARLNRALQRIAFFVLPSAVAFFFLGDVIAAAVLQTGRFGAADSRYLWYLLMGATVGLLAQALGRLYSSTFYALKDTRTPLKFAIVRVGLTAGLAYWSAVKLPGQLGIPKDYGAVGIAATTGLAAWIEFLLLRRKLGQRIGTTRIDGRRLLALWASAVIGAAVALAIKVGLAQAWGVAAMGSEKAASWLPAPAIPPWITAAAVLIPYGVTYLALTSGFGIPESRDLWRRFRRP